MWTFVKMNKLKYFSTFSCTMIHKNVCPICRLSRRYGRRVYRRCWSTQTSPPCRRPRAWRRRRTSYPSHWTTWHRYCGFGKMILQKLKINIKYIIALKTSNLAIHFSYNSFCFCLAGYPQWASRRHTVDIWRSDGPQLWYTANKRWRTGQIQCQGPGNTGQYWFILIYFIYWESHVFYLKYCFVDLQKIYLRVVL